MPDGLFHIVLITQETIFTSIHKYDSGVSSTRLRARSEIISRAESARQDCRRMILLRIERDIGKGTHFIAGILNLLRYDKIRCTVSRPDFPAEVARGMVRRTL